MISTAVAVGVQQQGDAVSAARDAVSAASDSEKHSSEPVVGTETGDLAVPGQVQ